VNLGGGGKGCNAYRGVSCRVLSGEQGPVIGDLISLGQPLGFGMAFVRTEQ
jgi:hypothetical protein